MAARRRQQDERAARVAWILDSALDVVIDEGLAALTTGRLAKQIGYTAPAMYRYFDSKQALLAALERHTAEKLYGAFFELHGRVRPALEAESPVVRALAEIALLVRTFTVLCQAHPAHLRLVTAIITADRTWNTGEATSSLRALVVPKMLEIFGYFERAEREGALDPGQPADRAMILWLGLCANLASTSVLQTHGELLDFDRMRHEMIRALFVGWGACSATADAALEAADQVVVEGDGLLTTPSN